MPYSSGMNALIPLPSAFFIFPKSPGLARIGLRPDATLVRTNHGFSEGRSFSQSDAPWYDGPANQLFQGLPDLFGDLAGEIRPVVVHCQDDSLDFKGGIEIRPNLVQGVEKVRIPSMQKTRFGRGTRTESAAVRALMVKKPREGGQSMRIILNFGLALSKAVFNFFPSHRR